MSRRKQALIDQARAQYGEILPCATRRSLEECFTEESGQLHFWFNLEDGNTKVLIEGRVV
ncbi:MAG: hypothetical protein JRJ29_21725 [Deltaproteobacteria bacterium]|nr:hypothetical protein [Deltaproteobacteria bacterium]